MNISKTAKIISAIVAVIALAAAVFVAVKKLTAKKEVEYFDDNDFFECDNEIEIVEAKAEEAPVEEAPAEEAPVEEEAPKKKPAKRTVKKAEKKDDAE